VDLLAVGGVVLADIEAPPDCGLRTVPSACADQFCAPLPLQVHSCTLVPLAVAPPATSRHLPRALIVLFGVTVHRCAEVPLQS
jgi:hypothetical protein